VNPVSDKSRPPRWWRGICALLAVFGAVLAAPAVTGAQGPARALSAGEVQIGLEAFGVGNVARRGDWAGIRLKIQDTASKQRDLVVRLAGIDSDGDTPFYTREVTTNPGVWQGVWMYAWLPFGYEPGLGLSVSVHETVEAETAPGDERVGRMVGYLELTPGGGSVVRSSEGLMAILGNRPLGMDMYNDRPPSGETWHPRGHEVTQLVLGLTPADMPDRLHGLKPFDAVVWGQGDPAELRGERANAVRDWVEQGGHFIVVLPSVGQTWTNPASNDLHDIMPTVAVSRREGVDMTAYRPLLARPTPPDRQDRFPKQGVVHSFRPLPGALPNEAMRILSGPDGECVVVTRLVGAGSVTLIGLDLNQTAFSQAGMVESDYFWHRVLGRRGDLSLPRNPNQPVNFGLSQRQPWAYDQDIPREIAKKGRAAAGVLVGFIVFVLYWLVAGPLGFAVLKAKRWSHHAWLSFVVAAAVFTAVSWTGASVLRPGKVEASHLTFLDHVYGQPLQRARMWASVMIPDYGTHTIGVGHPEERGPGYRSLNAITSWNSPNDDAGGGSFPDARGYSVDARTLDSIRVPTRSTVKQVQVDWAGGPRWKMPRPAGAEAGGTGDLRLNEPTMTGPIETRPPLVEGVLVHDLPGALTDISVFVVRGQRVRPPTLTWLISDVDAFPYSSWAPGDPLDLGALTRPKPNTLAQAFIQSLRPSLDWGNFQGEEVPRSEAGRTNDRLTALALFSQLYPPEAGGNATSQYAAQRHATHGWDLGRWFTQPCVIIVGHLVNDTSGERAASPVPLTVDGEPVPTEGRTVVRWVYPLPDNPPVVRTASELAEPEPQEQPGSGGEPETGGGN
jgi:hypothetical protein